MCRPTGNWWKRFHFRISSPKLMHHIINTIVTSEGYDKMAAGKKIVNEKTGRWSSRRLLQVDTYVSLYIFNLCQKLWLNSWSLYRSVFKNIFYQKPDICNVYYVIQIANRNSTGFKVWPPDPSRNAWRSYFFRNLSGTAIQYNKLVHK